MNHQMDSRTWTNGRGVEKAVEKRNSAASSGCRVPTQYTWRSNCEQRERRGGARRQHRPDVSHTLRMWLWLTFNLPAWPVASHPSLASHFPVRMSAVLLDTASAPRCRPHCPRPLTMCGLAASARPSLGGRNPARNFFNPLVCGISLSMATSSGLCLKDRVTHSSLVSADMEPTLNSSWELSENCLRNLFSVTREPLKHS